MYLSDSRLGYAIVTRHAIWYSPKHKPNIFAMLKVAILMQVEVNDDWRDLDVDKFLFAEPKIPKSQLFNVPCPQWSLYIHIVIHRNSNLNH